MAGIDILAIKNIPNHKLIPLKLGNFQDAQDGDEIYTCGYPFGMDEQFTSKGILSTKFIYKSDALKIININSILPQDAAWLDLTMNKGNSGGAIIKMGKTAEEDEVIGIATFIISSPFAKDAVRYLEISKNPGVDMVGQNGFTQSGANQLFSKALENSSYGISGCISIDYSKSFLIPYLDK